MMAQSMRDRILDAAEKRARIGGYHGFSFRDIAEDVGIKSASVHYHFSTKSDLVGAVADRYTVRAAENLTDPANFLEAIDQVTSLFRAALNVDDQMCLCGLLGAERDTIPETVAESSARFFRVLIDYLDAADPATTDPVRAETIVATLEGALILARNLRDPEIFERIVGDLTQRFV